MSAKDAPGEVNKNPNFDSPNITSAADEVMEMIDAEKAARKKAETVEIDGVPIDEKEVKFKAEDIKKKGKTEYFVNVEGAEQRKREAQRRAKLEAEEAKRRAKADDERVINELHKKAEQRKRENREVEQKAKAEDNRVIGELHKKAEKRKKENRAAKRKERNKKLHNFFFKGWHKFVTIGILVILIGGPLIYFGVQQIIEYQKRREEEIIKEEMKELDELTKTDVEMYVDSIIGDASKKIMQYQYTEGVKDFDDLIEKETDKRIIGQLYYKRSTLVFSAFNIEYIDVVLEDAKKAKSNYPESAEITYWLSDVYGMKGDESSSTKYKEEAIKLDSSNDENYEYTGGKG